jgi:hypothetical protein
LFARALQAEVTEFPFGVAVPAEMVARFFEIYSGPAKPAIV